MPTKDIVVLASMAGARGKDVEAFLDTVGQAGTEEGDMLSLYYEARLYGWDAPTILAIETGIKLAYSDDIASPKERVIDNIIETPLPAAHYSIWPRYDTQSRTMIPSQLS